MTILWTTSRERLVEEYEATGERLVDLASDQTSCHNPFLGGYYPVQVRRCVPLQWRHVSGVVSEITPRPRITAPLLGIHRSTNAQYSEMRNAQFVNSTGPRLNIKTVYPRYGDSHVRDKTVGRPPYL